MAGERLVRVAKGCIDTEDAARRLHEVVDKLAGAGFIVSVSFTMPPDLGCGTLYAIVGPRGGIRMVLFKGEKGVAAVTKSVMRWFKPTKVHDRTIFYKILRRYRLVDGA